MQVASRLGRRVLGIALATILILLAALVRAAPPVRHILDPDAEARLHEARRLWIESLHRAAPGVDWRRIEKANRMEQFLRRQMVLRSQGASPWTEVGALNVTGRTDVTVLGTDGQTIYVGTSNSGVFSGLPFSTTWTPRADDVGKGVQGMVIVPAAGGGEPETWVTMSEYTDVYATINQGASWFVPSGLPDDIWYGLRLVREPEASSRRVYLLVEGWVYSGDWVHAYYLSRSDDGGASFTVVHSEPIDGPRPDMWIARTGTSATLYLLAGAILKTSTNGGTSFTTAGSIAESPSAAVLAGCEAGVPDLYAAVEVAADWKLYRSLDAGATWEFRSVLSDFGFQSLCASIGTRDLLFTGGVNARRSADGGSTFTLINDWVEYYNDENNKLHADIRGIDCIVMPATAGEPTGSGGPTLEGEVFFFDTDGGTYASTDGGLQVRHINHDGLPNAQYYSILTSRNDPYRIAAGSQDQGFQLALPGVPPLGFYQDISGDYGHLTSTAQTWDRLWSVYPGFILLKVAEDLPGLEFPGFPADDGITFLPFVLADPADADALYFCARHLWRIERTAPDTYTRTMLAFDFGGDEGTHYLTALAVSPVDASRWWAVTDDGRLFTSDNASAAWIPSASTGPQTHFFYGTELLPSPSDRDVCYVAGAGYSGPAVYKTVNGGTDWTPMSAGLPTTLVFGLAFDNAIEQNLYAASEAGPFRFDSGSGTWEDLSATTCCPPLTTYWDVESLGGYGIVRYATYGRGIWDFATGSAVGVPGTEPRTEQVRLAIYPNPTRTRSTFEFVIAEAGQVQLEVFDIQGHRLATPFDAWRPAGRGQASFATRLANGRVLESGVYLVRLTTARGVEVSKLLIAR